MKIAFISSEAFPYAKTGGLGDVAGVLPKALEKAGCEVKLFIPKYSSIDEDKYELHYSWDIGELQIRTADHVRNVYLHQSKLQDSNVEVNFIDCPHYFHRDSIYTNDQDEDERFILFSKAVIEIIQKLNWIPDVIHCNDWPTGLLPLLIRDNYAWDKRLEKVASVFTIHNIGYQGRFSHAAMFKAELNGDYFYPGGPVEYENSVSFMKTAISFSDIISTVSETYANEILTPYYGSGMQDVLYSRRHDLFGILNGVDYSVWNPASDKFIPFNYSPQDLSGKEKNKEFLLSHFNMSFNKGVPLFGIISRMVSQKGFDIFAEIKDELMRLNAQWIILGSGEDNFEDLFKDMAYHNRDKVSVFIGYNNELSHLIEAGSDMFLMPSQYEPCGLNQIYSLKYGTVPVVRKTGGLADTVHDWDEYSYKGLDTGTGFSFDDYSGYALLSTIQRAISCFHYKPAWEKIMLNGMSKNFSWDEAAKEYVTLYEKAIAKRS